MSLQYEPYSEPLHISSKRLSCTQEEFDPAEAAVAAEAAESFLEQLKENMDKQTSVPETRNPRPET